MTLPSTTWPGHIGLLRGNHTINTVTGERSLINEAGRQWPWDCQVANKHGTLASRGSLRPRVSVPSFLFLSACELVTCYLNAATSAALSMGRAGLHGWERNAQKTSAVVSAFTVLWAFTAAPRAVLTPATRPFHCYFMPVSFLLLWSII